MLADTAPVAYELRRFAIFSVRAGNPYFIDFEVLEGDGLLERHEFSSIDWGSDPRRVDYSMLYDRCYDVLRIA